MTERDVEKDVSRAYFVSTLRRLADALEADEPFRIQVASRRFTVPGHASLVIEHEIESGEEELSFELHWSRDA
jgi:amphi-Trp domain-containing protein